ncbi:MAG: YkvA family protein [Dehalococcoidia bacterium]
MSWLLVLALVLVVLLVLGGGGVLAARDRRVREFIEVIEGLGWQGAARAVWGLARDPRVPWFVRLLPVPLLIYLASPIDLVPDFIPVLGQADDILIVAAALWVVLRYTPREVVAAHFGGAPREPRGR